MDINEQLQQFSIKLISHYHSTPSLIELGSLAEPCDYLLALGGKRIRPALCYFTFELFAEENVDILNACMALELFHNFTLMHDDIMDQAATRRGHATVHEKFGTNAALLSGDAMSILAYDFLSRLSPDCLSEALVQFNKTAIQVCEGQQLDFEFESIDNILYEDYIRMISLKTSVLLAYSCKLGALVGKASGHDQDLMYQFGLNLGIAFQLLDDYLDAFGESHETGKVKGGDILMNKKTGLYIKCIESLAEQDRQGFVYSYLQAKTPDDINQILVIFKNSGADNLLLAEIKKYTDLSLQALNQVSMITNQKTILHDISLYLLHRKH